MVYSGLDYIPNAIVLLNFPANLSLTVSLDNLLHYVQLYIFSNSQQELCSVLELKKNTLRKNSWMELNSANAVEGRVAAISEIVCATIFTYFIIASYIIVIHGGVCS